jgi:hypothetical protein
MWMNSELQYFLRRLKAGAIFVLLAFWICTIPISAGPGAVDVTGVWDVSITSQEGTAHPSLTLRQDGEKITGTYSGRMGDADLEGTLKGNDIRLTFALKFQDVSYTVTYRGTVTDNGMQGSASFSNGGAGTWSAKRRKSHHWRPGMP